MRHNDADKAHTDLQKIQKLGPLKAKFPALNKAGKVEEVKSVYAVLVQLRVLHKMVAHIKQDGATEVHLLRFEEEKKALRSMVEKKK